MIRLLHIPERHCVLLHPVPACHSKKGFIIFDNIDKTEECARVLLGYQEERENWLYSIGVVYDSHFNSPEKWKSGTDATVGRRIMDRI
jgi:hypothetical protein